MNLSGGRYRLIVIPIYWTIIHVRQVECGTGSHILMMRMLSLAAYIRDTCDK